MARAQVLEAMNDRAGAQGAYEAVIAQTPDVVTAQAAQARRALFRGDWAGAYRHFAAALKESPQDIELLDELEQVRSQMRPSLGAPQPAVGLAGGTAAGRDYASLAVRPLRPGTRSLGGQPGVRPDPSCRWTFPTL